MELSRKKKKQGKPNKPAKPKRSKKPVVYDDGDLIPNEEEVQAVPEVVQLAPFSSGLVSQEFAINDYGVTESPSSNTVYSTFIRGSAPTFLGSLVNRTGIVVHKGGRLF